MLKRVAISQSNYMPWIGYFDMINSVDVFVLLDNVQFTRRDWRNRNKIVDNNGNPRWITVPLQSKGHFLASVSEMQISDDYWIDKHLALIKQSYRKHPFYDEVFPSLCCLYGDLSGVAFLSQINMQILHFLCDFLEINTVLSSIEGPIEEIEPNTRLAQICQSVSAGIYISGPSAKTYLNESVFGNFEVDVEYFEYPSYGSLQGLEMVHPSNCSILDTLFRVGPEVLINFFKLRSSRVLGCSNFL